MDRLEQFATFEEDNDLHEEPEPYNPQNDFPGIAPDGIHVFEQDTKPSKGGVVDSIPGCKFVMASTKIGLWNLQTREANLFGINNPFSRRDYKAFLNTLDKSAVDMLAERMEHYDLPCEGAILFGLDGMIKVLHAHQENLYLIVYPNGDEEITTDPNNTFKKREILDRLESYVGKKIWLWIKKKVSELTGQAE